MITGRAFPLLAPAAVAAGVNGHLPKGAAGATVSLAAIPALADPAPFT